MLSVIMESFETGSRFTNCVNGRISSHGFEVQSKELRLPCPGSGIYRARGFGLLEYSLDPPPAARAGYPRLVSERPVGKLVFIPPGSTLQWHWAEGHQRSMAVAFDTRRLDTLAGLCFDWSSANLPDTLTLESPYIESMMKELACEASEPGYGCETKAAAMVTLLVLELGRRFAAPDRLLREEAKQDAAVLRRLREYVISDDALELTAMRAATICNLSPRALSSLLVRTLGMTLRTYLANARLERAKHLLIKSDKLVKQIAYAAGFKGTAAFGAAFRRAYGVTPLEYRQQQH